MSLEVSNAALIKLDAFEQVGDNERLGIPYAILEHPSGVELTLTQPGLAMLETEIGFGFLVGHMRDRIANNLGYDRAATATHRDEILGIPVDVLDHGGPGYSPSNTHFEQTVIKYNNRVVTGVQVTSFDHPDSSKSASTSLEVMSWLHKKLDPTDGTTDSGQVIAPAQYGKMTSLHSGHSVTLSQEVPGTSLFDLLYRNKSLSRPDAAALWAESTAYVQERLHKNLGRVGRRLVRAGERNDRSNIVVTDNALIGDALNPRIDYDAAKFFIVDQPSMPTKGEVRRARFLMKLL